MAGIFGCATVGWGRIYSEEVCSRGNGLDAIAERSIFFCATSKPSTFELYMSVALPTVFPQVFRLSGFDGLVYVSNARCVSRQPSIGLPPWPPPLFDCYSCDDDVSEAFQSPLIVCLTARIPRFTHTSSLQQAHLYTTPPHAPCAMCKPVFTALESIPRRHPSEDPIRWGLRRKIFLLCTTCLYFRIPHISS